MSTDLIDPKKHHQLFLDSRALVSEQGTTRTLHPLQKCGPCITGGVQSRSAPLWNPDEERYEWWYNGPQARLAISRDGEHWEQPSLGLYECDGSTDNNIACDPNGPGLYHIVRDERDPDPNRRYKALFGVQWPRRCRLARRLCLDSTPQFLRPQPRRIPVRVRPLYRAIPRHGQATHRVGPLGLAGDQPRLRPLHRARAHLPRRRNRLGKLPPARPHHRRRPSVHHPAARR